ncbi:MAG: hypothetical protein EA351_01770 [Gemmatimonadales bacterium]|nr:MAG: hypothetical protein EA351_01770 [Gemmatimonadales bacterium]
MSRSILLVVLVAVLGCAPGDSSMEAPDGEPSLAVVLVIDQLTPELLERYDAVWTGGFRRLLDGGHQFSDAVQDHAITFTSPGHASPTTGVVPARHGIVGNSWREWRDGMWESVSSVADPDTELVGGSGSGSSPRNLLVDGLPDWLLEQRPGSRVVSLSGKSTAGVLMGGRAAPTSPTGDPDARHVYWFSASNEGFVTSTHYREALPDWVQAFNRTIVERVTTEDCWEPVIPEEFIDLSRRDRAEYEADGVHIAFPHCIDDEPYRGAAHFVTRTPALDLATLEFATEAIAALDLGQRESPDYLSLALSATDRVGHEWGPFSREQFDNLVRLDRELGRWFERLDQTVGPDRYVVALTSDHGVLPLPEYLEEQGLYGLRLTSELGEAYSEASEGLDPSGPEHTGEDGAAARAELAERLERVEWVEAAMPFELLASDTPADSFVVLYRKSFHPDRLSTRMANHGVETRLVEGTLVRATGTTHGVPYLHDRSVPLLFYGAGLEAGVSTDPVRTVDLAPTLGRMLGVSVPEGLDGRDLLSR